MAVLRIKPSRSKAPALVDKVVTVNREGTIYVRKWPPKGISPKAPYVKETVARFVEANRLAKLADPLNVIVAMHAAKNSGLYPRDILVKAMLTGFFRLRLPDGRIITRAPLTYEVPVFLGARVYRTNTYTVGAGATVTVSFDTPVLNPIGIWNPSAPTLFTVPAGVGVMSFEAGVGQNASYNNNLQISIVRVSDGFRLALFNQTGNTNKRMLAATGPCAVLPGQTYRLDVFNSTAATMSGGADLAWFACTVLGQLPSP